MSATILLTVTMKGKVVCQKAFAGHQRILIGRGAESDIRLDNAAVSRLHAQIVWIGDTCQVEDLGSENGIRLNGTDIHAAELEDRDVIHIGKYLLHVHLCESADAANPPALLDSWREDVTARGLGHVQL